MDLYHNTSKVPVNGNTVKRPRVNALLEEGMKYPAVVVAAGAGFGKTQAVAGFLEDSAYRSVWFQLTALDNFPTRFWESFVYTVSLHREPLSEKLKELGFPDSLYKYHAFLKLLAEELYTDDRFVVFVFDDFQLLQDEAVYRFFQYFVSANMENICLLFITRDLESYSFSSAVYVLTTEDLRFTQEEAALFFEKRGVELRDGAELEKIYSYTGGWAMALNLVALQLQKSGLQGEERLAGSQQMIFKLIEKEIFAQYNEEEQRFFTSLSVLNFFPYGLVRGIGEKEGVDAARLLQNNVLVSYDSQAKHYYLQQVFLDYLEDKQFLIGDGAKKELFCDAANWAAGNGYYVDAIDYYDRCGRPEKVWEVIRGFGGVRHAKDETDLFIRYIKRFPEKFMEETPMCRLVYAMLLLSNLQVEEAWSQLDKVFARLEAEGQTGQNRQMWGEAYTAAGVMSLGVGNEDFVALFKKAAERLPEGSGRWGKNLRLVEFSNALRLSGAGAGEAERSVRALMEGMPYASRVLHGAGYGLEYLAAAEAGFLTGELKKAERDAYKALYMAQEKKQDDIADNALFLLLRMFLVGGAEKSIRETLEQISRQKKDDTADIQMQGVLDVALGWFYSELGNTARVEEWILYDRDDDPPPLSVDKESLLRARCWIEEQRYFEALALLDRLEKIYKKRNTLISMIYAHVYRAVIFYQTDDTENALRALKDAYDLAHGNGFTTPFVEFGHKTRSLVDYARQREDAGIPKDWLANIYTKASTYAKRHAYMASRFAHDGNEARDFGLTQREIELLRNLSQGLTRDEIAASMYVSPNTVKSMLKTVYNKIGAVNSADAVRIGIGADLI